MTFYDAWDVFFEPYRRAWQLLITFILRLLTLLLDWLASFVKIV